MKQKPVARPTSELVAEFWESHPNSLHPQTTIAAVLGCSLAKLEADRWRGRGIKFRRLSGGIVRYEKSDVVAALGDPVQSTTEADECDARVAA